MDNCYPTPPSSSSTQARRSCEDDEASSLILRFYYMNSVTKGEVGYHLQDLHVIM